MKKLFSMLTTTDSNSPKKKHVSVSLLLVVILLASVSSYFFVTTGVKHSRTPDPQRSVLSAEDMTEIKEKFTEYEGEEVNDVRATADGALLILDHRLVSIGGPEWEEMWSYERREKVDQVIISPNGYRIHTIFKGSLLPWEKDSITNLLASNGNSFYERPFDFITEEPETGEYYFSEEHSLWVSQQTEGSYMRAYDLEAGKLSWEKKADSFCAQGQLDDSSEMEVTPVSLGFILSYSCLLENGNWMKTVTHIEDSTGREYWREEWDTEQAGNINIFYLSGSLVPWTEEDLLAQVLAPSKTDTNYVFIANGRYLIPTIFDYPPIREVFPNPLKDNETPPDLLIFGKANEIDLQVAFQGAQHLIQDPSINVEEDDFSLLELRGPNGLTPAISHRSWPGGTSPAGVPVFAREMAIALNKE